jgi:hypothetical protein
MKKLDKLQDRTVDQLVQPFVAIALDQDTALLRREHARFNRLFDEMEAVEGELKARDGDQRRALLSLYDHPNIQVRVKAVKTTLAVTSEGGVARTERNRRIPEVSAGRRDRHVKRGIFKPS